MGVSFPLQPGRTLAGPVLWPRSSPRPPPAVSWSSRSLENGFLRPHPREHPCHGEQDSSAVFLLLFLGTNFVSFTTEPEHHSETQGQDSSVSRSALPAISPALLCTPTRGQHSRRRRRVRGAVHILAEHLRQLSCPLHGVPTPTGPGPHSPGRRQPGLRSAATSTRPRGSACAQPRLDGGLFAGTAVGGNLAGLRVVADEGAGQGHSL
uniref:Uncharacterized protein n=1 Tax=Myotis myotis TaxID=51298 RepID=A0A7J7RCI2_MYOMY|nr:hypothetical protein mMyoMyo1_010825 [Myotis myotis]